MRSNNKIGMRYEQIEKTPVVHSFTRTPTIETVAEFSPLKNNCVPFNIFKS